MFHRLALSCLILSSSTAVALACSCGPTEFSHAFDTATDIFLGKAVQLELPEGGCPGSAGLAWTFEKSGFWKGDDSNRAVVHTDCSEASCGFSFTLGEEYIVFSTFSGGIQALYTHLCTKTVESQWADAALLEFLGTPNSVVAAESTSWSTLKSRY